MPNHSCLATVGVGDLEKVFLEVTGFPPNLHGRHRVTNSWDLLTPAGGGVDRAKW